MRYVAHDRGVEIHDVAVDVAMEIADGRVTSAGADIRLTAEPDVDTSALVHRATEVSTVLAAARAGFPVDVALSQ